MGRKGASAVQVWSGVPRASRTVTIPAGDYSIRASSTQQSQCAVNAATSATFTISSVTTTRTVVIGQGNDANNSAGNLDRTCVKATLTNATTVTGSKLAAIDNSHVNDAILEAV